MICLDLFGYVYINTYGVNSMTSYFRTLALLYTRSPIWSSTRCANRNRRWQCFCLVAIKWLITCHVDPCCTKVIQHIESAKNVCTSTHAYNMPCWSMLYQRNPTHRKRQKCVYIYTRAVFRTIFLGNGLGKSPICINKFDSIILQRMSTSHQPSFINDYFWLVSPIATPSMLVNHQPTGVSTKPGCCGLRGHCLLPGATWFCQIG